MADTRRFLDDNGISQADLIPVLELDDSTISRKLSGKREWKVTEMQKLRAYVSERLGRVVALDELFPPAGAPQSEPLLSQGSK